MDEQLVKQLSNNIVELTYQIQVLVQTIEHSNKVLDNVSGDNSFQVTVVA